MKFLKPLVKLGQIAGSLFIKNPGRKDALENVNKIVDPFVDELEQELDKPTKTPTIDPLIVIQTLIDAKLTPEQIKVVLKLMQGN